MIRLKKKKDQGEGCINSGIYIIYIGSRRAIYNDIAASTSGKNSSSGSSRALGPSALGHGMLPSEEFFALGFGAISLYIALRDPIYTLHIYKYPTYMPCGQGIYYILYI